MHLARNEDNRARNLDRWALKVLWTLPPVYLLMALMIAFGLLRNTWSEWFVIVSLTVASSAIPTLAFRFNLSARLLRYLTCAALFAEVWLVSVVLGDVRGIWPLWLLPVAMGVVYSDRLLSSINTLGAVVMST